LATEHVDRERYGKSSSIAGPDHALLQAYESRLTSELFSKSGYFWLRAGENDAAPMDAIRGRKNLALVRKD
jgi:hypothetical protein